MVVLLSGHGEDLAEHSPTANHGWWYDTCLRVPLVVADPGRPGGGELVETVVQAVDLAPTVLERSGIPPDMEMDGVSLGSPLGWGSRPYQEREVFSMTGRRSVSLRTSGEKLIFWGGREYDASDARGAGGRVEFYDLLRDPGETRNLVVEGVAVDPGLLERLSRWMEARDERRALGTLQRLGEAGRRLLQERGYWSR